MTQSTRPCDNPFNAQRVDALDYVEFGHRLSDVIGRLKQNKFRGAICGPHGCGKTAMLQALGGELIHHGFAPLPLFINSDQRGTLPADWRRNIRNARPTDALLLDGFDLLPMRARLWVRARSRRAGAVVVTSHRDAAYPTIARPNASPALLGLLVERLAPNAGFTIHTNRLFEEAGGNLRDALRLAYDLYPAHQEEPASGRPARSEPAL